MSSLSRNIQVVGLAPGCDGWQVAGFGSAGLYTQPPGNLGQKDLKVQGPADRVASSGQLELQSKSLSPILEDYRGGGESKG